MKIERFFLKAILFAATFLALSACSGIPSGRRAVTETVDIVVIGGGGAGVTAASLAVNAGKSVILLEKMSFLFGATGVATTQMWAAGSSLQREYGLTETAEDFYNFLITTGRNRGLEMRSDTTRIMTQRSGEMIDWLVSVGVPFTRVFNVWSHGPAGGAAPGPAFALGLQAELDRRNIDYRLNNRATELIMRDGGIVGVRVSGPSGVYTVNAKAVVIATGGFANNPDIVATHDPRWATIGSSAAVSSTGDGILMAQAVGADVVDMDVMTINPTVFYSGDLRVSLTALRANGAIMVNKQGTRFTNEMGGPTVQTLAMLEQEDQAAFMVFDETMIRTVGFIRDFRDRGFFEQADSVEELANRIGINAAGLRDTVERYKTFVRNDHDPEFGRTFMAIDFENPPFYAVRVAPAIQSTFGGIKVDERMQVIDTNGNIIPGLFAAGDTAGDGTKGVTPLTATFVFGRIAGESAVAYVSMNY